MTAHSGSRTCPSCAGRRVNRQLSLNTPSKRFQTHRRKSEDDPETPDWLGNDVEDTKEEHLCVGRQTSRSLAESPNNGVSGPHNGQGKRDLVVEASDLGMTQKGVLTSRSDERNDDVDECKAAECVKAPSVLEGWVQGGNDSRGNHDFIGDNDGNGLGNGQARKERQVEDEQGCGECPVQVSCIVDFSPVGSVVWVRVDERLSNSSRHGKVGNGGKGADEQVGNVEGSVSVGGTVSQGSKDEHTD